MGIRQTVGKKIPALYERLSRNDKSLGDSNSIINQKRYLEGYAADHGYGNICRYTDDGWLGGNFDRPAWKQLIDFFSTRRRFTPPKAAKRLLLKNS